jgi:hypothetical protein
MSQHDFVIDSQGAPAARTDINNGLQALASQSSGDTEPSTTYANQPWYETDTNTLKMRNEANSGWLNFGYIDQSSGFRPFEGDLVDTSGTKTAYLGVHAEATWETGTNTEARLVSPAHVKAAIAEQAMGTFTSTDQTITSGGTLTIAHGLGVEPIGVSAFLVCQVADAGYSIGEVVALNTGENAIEAGSYGHSIVVDNTNLNIKISGGYQIITKTTGLATTITLASWKLRFKAWG